MGLAVRFGCYDPSRFQGRSSSRRSRRCSGSQGKAFPQKDWSLKTLAVDPLDSAPDHRPLAVKLLYLDLPSDIPRSIYSTRRQWYIPNNQRNQNSRKRGGGVRPDKNKKKRQRSTNDVKHELEQKSTRERNDQAHNDIAPMKRQGGWPKCRQYLPEGRL